MIRYPDSLPIGLISKNSIKDTPTASNVKFASGNSRQRKTMRLATSSTVFSFVFNSEQVQVFESWYENEINHGADWFLIKRKTANGVEHIEARFKSMYSGANKIGLTDGWSIEFQAEIKRNDIGDDWWLFPDFAKYWCCIDQAVNVCWPSEFPQFDKNKCLIDVITNKEWP